MHPRLYVAAQWSRSFPCREYSPLVLCHRDCRQSTSQLPALARCLAQSPLGSRSGELSYGTLVYTPAEHGGCCGWHKLSAAAACPPDRVRRHPNGTASWRSVEHAVGFRLGHGGQRRISYVPPLPQGISGSSGVPTFRHSALTCPSSYTRRRYAVHYAAWPPIPPHTGCTTCMTLTS
jgi:hypothetical protein